MTCYIDERQRLADAMRGCHAGARDAAQMIPHLGRNNRHTVARYLDYVRLLSLHIETWQRLYPGEAIPFVGHKDY